MDIDSLSFREKLNKASKGQLQLRDNDGCVFWVDTYDDVGETAYIHMDEGDTHLIGWERLQDAFTFIETNN